MGYRSRWDSSRLTMPVSVGLGWICPAGFGDSPGSHRATVSKSPEKSQTYYHKEERSAVQNKELTKANKTTLRFAGHQEPPCSDQVKATRKARLPFNTNPCIPERTVWNTKQENGLRLNNEPIVANSFIQSVTSRLQNEL